MYTPLHAGRFFFMAIRESKLNWTAYRKAAKNLKISNPGITPQQIIGRLGYPLKNGQRIFITSDGSGGIKERSRTAHQARNVVREKRRRIQTGKLTPEKAAELRRLKDTIRAQGMEPDHINEIFLVGQQLEDLEKRGGDVQGALDILRGAGYGLGDDRSNIQPLTPAENKEKNQQVKQLQDYLKNREALGRSPSAYRPNLIMTGAEIPALGGYVLPGLGPNDPFRIFTTAHRPEPVQTGTPGIALNRPSLPNVTAPQQTPGFTPQTVFESIQNGTQYVVPGLTEFLGTAVGVGAAVMSGLGTVAKTGLGL